MLRAICEYGDIIKSLERTMINLKKVVSNVVKATAATAVVLSVVGCTGSPYEEQVNGRNDVVTLGDSIFDLNGVIQETLEANAGTQFRDYTQSGAELQGGSLAPSVYEQYAAANSFNGDINTILMDGGGNDILIPATLFDPYGCRTQWYRWNPSRSCRNLIEDQRINAVNLLNQMDADGVANVVWLGYYELPRGNANLTKALNIGNNKLRSACQSDSVASCQFVDPRGTVPASQVESDDIHPTPEGSVNLAGQIEPVLFPLL